MGAYRVHVRDVSEHIHVRHRFVTLRRVSCFLLAHNAYNLHGSPNLGLCNTVSDKSLTIQKSVHQPCSKTPSLKTVMQENLIHP